jgi:hypothetical protein
VFGCGEGGLRCESCEGVFGWLGVGWLAWGCVGGGVWRGPLFCPARWFGVRGGGFGLVGPVCGRGVSAC